MQLANELPLAVPIDCDQYLQERLTLLDAAVPDEAQSLIGQSDLH